MIGQILLTSLSWAINCKALPTGLVRTLVGAAIVTAERTTCDKPFHIHIPKGSHNILALQTRPSSPKRPQLDVNGHAVICCQQALFQAFFIAIFPIFVFNIMATCSKRGCSNDKGKNEAFCNTCKYFCPNRKSKEKEN
ncbi:hypothetical protein QBC40DRAFT_297530 [Triangularia verruculosa]|uniref:Secreted protein n=1 Tax=Triangularia verruculosa TaxID=2587418 RepID=A0AAN6XFQ9_9PEZI|nr:hypothetical protein QBC40DRAFT_297530 [Triangularia verruculosa]